MFNFLRSPLSSNNNNGNVNNDNSKYPHYDFARCDNYFLNLRYLKQIYLNKKGKVEIVVANTQQSAVTDP